MRLDYTRVFYLRSRDRTDCLLYSLDRSLQAGRMMKIVDRSLQGQMSIIKSINMHPHWPDLQGSSIISV